MTKVVMPIALVIGTGMMWNIKAPAVSLENPYQGIAQTNVFRLKTPPPLKPVVELRVPLPVVKLLGVTTILPEARAILKVQMPAANGQPPREETHVLKAHERVGPIEVIGINELAGTIQVNNSGTIMLVEIEKLAPSLPGPPGERSGVSRSPNSSLAAPAPSIGLAQPQVQPNIDPNEQAIHMLAQHVQYTDQGHSMPPLPPPLKQVLEGDPQNTSAPAPQ